MILLGCLLAFTAAFAPRLILIIAWIFGDRWAAVWQGEWLVPLLGIIFLPYTTIMYLLVWSPALAPGAANIEGVDWLWVLLGLFLDIWKWVQMWQNRQEAQKQAVKYYPSGAPRIPTGAAAASTAAPAAPAAPASTPAPAEPASTPEPAPPAEPAAAPQPPSAPAEAAPEADQLAELDKLKASGVLTDEEYEQANAKLDQG
ncbi:MAG: SHOCT domain-containing protein [Chloroflexota bacterium]|jgi:hypothetical protein